MNEVSVEIQDKNAEISLGLLGKYGNECINCTQIAYYVDDDLLFKEAGEIMINRRDSTPMLTIKSPIKTGIVESK